MKILAQDLPEGRVASVAAEFRPDSFQPLFVHPFCVIQRTPGRQLRKHPGTDSEVTARSQRCHRRPVGFYYLLSFWQELLFKAIQQPGTALSISIQMDSLLLGKDDYSIAGINPQEEEGNSVGVETGFYPYP